MTSNNLPLLHLLGVKYNHLLNSSVFHNKPPDTDDDSGCDLISASNTVSKDMDMEAEELETEMSVLILLEKIKQKSAEYTAFDLQIGNKKGKYNMSKMIFTNPYTM